MTKTSRQATMFALSVGNLCPNGPYLDAREASRLALDSLVLIFFGPRFPKCPTSFNM
jgi:hypothetical protein